MISIVATLKALPGNEDAVAKVMAKMAEGTRKEPGNLRYDLYRSLDDPSSFMFYEDYADQDAIKAHASSDHLKAGFAELNSLLDGKVTIRRLQEIQQ